MVGPLAFHGPCGTGTAEADEAGFSRSLREKRFWCRARRGSGGSLKLLSSQLLGSPCDQFDASSGKSLERAQSQIGKGVPYFGTPFLEPCDRGLDFGDVDCSRPFFPLLNVKGNTGAFGEGLEAGPVDS